MVAQLAYHVSTGQSLWYYPVRKSTVLYLALEDDYKRLQNRMFRMFGVDCTEDLHFATCAKQIGNGLEDQLELFLKEHPDTRLVIVDTLQKVRELGSDTDSYASDYEIVGKLKQFADKYGICLLLGLCLLLTACAAGQDTGISAQADYTVYQQDGELVILTQPE